MGVLLFAVERRRRDVRGAFVPGKLQAYLDAQYAPLSDVVQACVVRHADQLVSDQTPSNLRTSNKQQASTMHTIRTRTRSHPTQQVAIGAKYRVETQGCDARPEPPDPDTETDPREVRDSHRGGGGFSGVV